jgi:hypothetical protein
MDLYIATGPFHIFNILNLKLHENQNQEGVLVVVAIFSSAELYADNIRKSKLFKDVILISKDEYNKLDRNCIVQRPKLWRYVQRVCWRANKHLYSNLPFTKICYQRIYMGGFIDAFASFIARQIADNHALLYYFDDGWDQGS